MDASENKKEVEIDVSDALLDTGLLVTIPAPQLLRLFGIKKIPVRFKRPVYAQLLRISRLYVSMNIDLQKIEESEAIVLLTEVARHGKNASRLIALGLIRSSSFSFLFHRLVARYLRRRMDAKTMAELAKLVVALSGAEHFTTIIRSIAHLRVSAPSLSQKETGS